ncbi:DUF916 and DUF3324 domain-containing protein [Lactiplantibacillus daowaiensis]|uniref:DUF916 and DUF3324 domain-containing protein n=1 Tax=Lactiplantibacillus daowaiensis TaxID=2559918 RepID=A0ABW1S2A1_9LACO|nr:DUF916 and DUF3324 domain-containing protein [Lactiplantibacillus daowaiensis]
MLKNTPWLVLTALILAWLGFSQPTQASTNHFSVQTELPSNQVNKKVSYFDLKVSPKQNQTIYIKIKNHDKIAHTYTVATNLATTNDNGVIIYNDLRSKPDSSLTFNIADAVAGKQTVQVAAKSTKRIGIKLELPVTPFKGVALGGINIYQQSTNQDDQPKSGLSLQNKFGYVIGLQLREQTKVTVKPDLKLLTVGPRQVNHRNYVNAKLQNPHANLLHGLKVTSYVTKVGSTKQLLKTTKSQLEMAPNSHFNFALGDGTTELTAGNYQLHLKSSAENGAYQWRFTKKFTVTAAKAKQLKQTTLPDTMPPTNWRLIAFLVSIIVLLLALVIWLLIRHRRQST